MLSKETNPDFLIGAMATLDAAAWHPRALKPRLELPAVYIEGGGIIFASPCIFPQ